MLQAGIPESLVYWDKTNDFIERFVPDTGFYIRSGVLVDGKDSNKDPFMRDFPQLIDFGVMGSCEHGELGLCAKAGIECYQNGRSTLKRDISVGDFEFIVKQCKGRTFQMALGGRGDVDLHEHYSDLLKICRMNGIVPNFTTSGLRMTEEIARECKKWVGAVAVSWYRSDYTLNAIDVLISAGIKTNIHYVLGNNSIEEAVDRLLQKNFPQNINAVIFLLHKPIGQGREENVLNINDMRVHHFFELINSQSFPFKIGFDSCSCPGIVNISPDIDISTIDYCEGARFSCYIDAQLNMMPCSFTNGDPEWSINLRECSVADAWMSKPFKKFRDMLFNACPGCSDRDICGGGCPIVNQITLCGRNERVYQFV